MPPRRVIQNDGRIVYVNHYNYMYNRLYMNHFSVIRLMLLSSIGLLLWYSNPPNIPSFIVQNKHHWKQYNIIPYQQYERYTRRKMNYNSITNYGFLSIVDVRSNSNNYHDMLTSQIKFIGFFGYEIFSITCKNDYNDSLQSIVCTQVRKQLCHERPLLPISIWNNNQNNKKQQSSYFYNTIYTNSNTTTNDDIPYIIHRIICWSMIFIALLTLCFYNRQPNTIISNNVFIDGLLTIFVTIETPLYTALMNCIYNALFIYPTLCRMYEILPLQHMKSIFRFVSSSSNINNNDNLINYILSCICLISVAVGINALSKIFSNNNTCTLKYHALLAVALGYYRGTTESYDNSNDFNTSGMFSSSSLLYPNGPSLNAITWFFIFSVFYQHKSILSALLWIIGNVIGYSMGQYQYENIYIIVSMNNVLNVFQDSVHGFWDTMDRFYKEIQQFYHDY